MIRRAAVAGSFYPGSKEQLTKAIEWCFDYNKKKTSKKEFCLGAVVPHAGYPYSGPVAASVYSRIKGVDFIIFGPNHYGMGSDVSIMTNGQWETPLGTVNINDKLASLIKGGYIEDDEKAHSREHSIEVQLPFLQYTQKEFEFVPITIKHYSPEENFLKICEDVGKRVADGITKYKKNVTILASTDFTHYEPHDVAKDKDSKAIDKILDFDPKGLFDVIAEYNISMCGYAGVASMLFAAKKLGAKKAEKILYMTSGDTSGDKSTVVGYGGIIIK